MGAPARIRPGAATPRTGSAGTGASAEAAPVPLRVAVLVDLEWGPGAGGHVRVWERIAEAASRAPELIELVVVAEGRRETRRPAGNVRIELVPPLLGTRRLWLRDAVADHTDLAPLNPRLFPLLRGVDVVHTTDAYFAQAATARLLTRRGGTALATSIHTDTPGYTRLYSAAILGRLLGGGPLARLVVERLRLPDRLAAHMRRRLARHCRRCDHVFVSAREAGAADGRTSLLRRGIDLALFNPSRRDRARLAAEGGIPESRFLLCFVGRLDRGKSVMTLAQAGRRLIEAGVDLHLVCAGAGPEQPAIAALLGGRVTLPGVVSQETLARLYAGADLFVLPSRIEQAPNVVLEAKASGRAVVVAPSGGGVFVHEDGRDGVLVADEDPAAWATAIEALLHDPARRAAIGAAARADVEAHVPSWDAVLREDLLPGWRAAAAARAGR